MLTLISFNVSRDFCEKGSFEEKIEFSRATRSHSFLLSGSTLTDEKADEWGRSHSKHCHMSAAYHLLRFKTTVGFTWIFICHSVITIWNICLFFATTLHANISYWIWKCIHKIRSYLTSVLKRGPAPLWIPHPLSISPLASLSAWHLSAFFWFPASVENLRELLSYEHFVPIAALMWFTGIQA